MISGVVGVVPQTILAPRQTKPALDYTKSNISADQERKRTAVAVKREKFSSAISHYLQSLTP